MQEMTDKEFLLISNYIKDNYGINMDGDKKSLVYSRLKSILDKNGLKNFTEYYEYLTKDKTGNAAITFIDKMTTNHTFFMREIDHFDFLKQKVLPYIESNEKNKDVRIWCAGCSSGEESYTLEMILTDYFKNKGNWDTELLATDISSQVLKKAIKGVYTKDQIKPLSEEWKKNYFYDINDKQVSVVDSIKSKITYRKFNLMEPKFPFKKKFQVIFCRNVMIYFDDETRTKLIKKFYDASEKGAYLFIGHSETLNNIKTDYEYIMPAVYRKK
ncbi:CheR family methyltransferase [[Clostridium] colinum]|uniref:CheR family methyltransferase n=1 Tax=[Clostridium] colinum TaxID=36835 RepID=UPI0020258011|nr:protein-glutamate O-methyltransferase CheR [[Clostridium] colinum]